MRRPARRWMASLVLAVLVIPPTAGAQPATKMPKVGVLQVGTATATQALFEAFREGMRERGYVEGQHVVFDRRQGDGRPERVAELAAELVRTKVDVLVTSTDQGIAALKQQTRTIPIVMANSTDPVATGFVASLARPGGNVTGNSSMSPELSGKRVALLREVSPVISRVAMLWNPDIRGAVLDYRETESAARALRMQLQSVEVSRDEDFDRAFAAITAARAEALIVPPTFPLAYSNRQRIVRFAQQSRILSVFGTRDFAEVGGLMAYGPNAADQWRRAAAFVDQILKGARPGDLPVQQPSKFEFVVNLKAAQALGITIPPGMLKRADHLIQ